MDGKRKSAVSPKPASHYSSSIAPLGLFVAVVVVLAALYAQTHYVHLTTQLLEAQSELQSLRLNSASAVSKCARETQELLNRLDLIPDADEALTICNQKLAMTLPVLDELERSFKDCKLNVNVTEKLVHDIRTDMRVTEAMQKAAEGLGATVQIMGLVRKSMHMADQMGIPVEDLIKEQRNYMERNWQKGKFHGVTLEQVRNHKLWSEVLRLFREMDQNGGVPPPPKPTKKAEFPRRH